MAKWLGSILILMLLCSPAAALNIPKATGYVNDNAGILSPTVKLKLEQFLQNFEESDSTQITLLTIPTLDGEALDNYSLKVFEAWKLGQKGKDNGALLLVAKAERKIRIEVGYGLE
ncbi:MAG: TPM domain-containing protein, partial [Desulfuromusa sp.]|nr:TPM domain-containing protein [Desulfuromusa sp.]